MPIYEYKATEERSCEYCREGFEVTQRMSEAPLTECPRCGAPVSRVISAFSVGKGNILSSSNLKAHGFTRLRKVDKGTYVKD